MNIQIQSTINIDFKVQARVNLYDIVIDKTQISDPWIQT